MINTKHGSPKRKEFLREKQISCIAEALSLGDIESGSGLNQEFGLIRLGDTRWSTYFKCIKNVRGLF